MSHNLKYIHIKKKFDFVVNLNFWPSPKGKDNKPWWA